VVERKNKLFAPKWDSIYKHVGHMKANKVLGMVLRKGIGIIPKFVNMPRTGNCMLPIVVKVLLPKL
jgi:hypothetical protein